MKISGRKFEENYRPHVEILACFTAKEAFEIMMMLAWANKQDGNTVGQGKFASGVIRLIKHSGVLDNE